VKPWAEARLVGVLRLWPLLCLFGGLAVYFILFRFVFDPFTPPGHVLGRIAPVFLWEAEAPVAGAIVAADLEARYRFAFASVLLTLVCIGGVAAAIALALAPLRRAFAWLAGAGGLVGALIGYNEQWASPLRGVAADCLPGAGGPVCPLNQAVARAGELGPVDAATLSHVQMVVSLNSITGVGAMCVLVIAFMGLAWTDTATPDARALWRRRRGFAICLAFTTLALSLQVATVHGFYHWSAALMTEEHAKYMTSIASSATLYWGAVYTTVLLVIALPAAISISLDIRRASEAAAPDGDEKAREEWVKAQGLVINVRQAAAALLAAASPVLTGPALDAAAKVAL
jgi:hypothetical protein